MKTLLLLIEAHASTAGKEAAMRHYGLPERCRFEPPAKAPSFTDEQLARREAFNNRPSFAEYLAIQDEQLARYATILHKHVHRDLTDWAKGCNHPADSRNPCHSVMRGTELDMFVANYSIEAHGIEKIRPEFGIVGSE